jgi:hypothetical protein
MLPAMGLTDLFRREPPVDPQVAAQLRAAWDAYIAAARDDERAHELAEQQQAAQPVAAALAALPPGVQPARADLLALLDLVLRSHAERDTARSERLDALIAELRGAKRELHLNQLATAWQGDELARSRALVANALQGRLVYIPAKADGTPPLLSELIAALLGVAAPPPRPEAHGGQRQPGEADPPASPPLARREGESELELVRRVLAAALDGQATAAKVRRAIDDEALANRLVELVEEHRMYRAILQRVGVLPQG